MSGSAPADARETGPAEPRVRQVPGVYHRRIGDVLVTAISDGYLDAPFEVLRNLSAEEAERALRASLRRSPPRISVNCFLLRTAGQTAIVDTGSGDSMGPTLGWLPETMAAVGVTREDVDTVLLTHMHPDHSNGLAGPGGERLFPNARIVVAEDEIRHWHDDGAMARANERQRTRYFEAARVQAAPYRHRIEHARGEVFPRVTALPLPGHTPGHTGYLIESDGERLLIWGDICHVPDIQVPWPEITMIFDSDTEAAVATRRRAFDMAASERLLVAGMHLHFPGFSHVLRDGAGYRLNPEAWTFTL